MTMDLTSLAKRFGQDTCGAALVEMTLVAPFMLLLSAGVFEFSNIIQTRLLLEAGVEDGARYLARCNSDQTTCETNAKNIAVFGATAAGAARVTGWAASAVTISYVVTPIVVGNNGLANYRSPTANVTTATLASSYAYGGTGLWGYLGFGALTLSVSHQERVFGW